MAGPGRKSSRGSRCPPGEVSVAVFVTGALDQEEVEASHQVPPVCAVANPNHLRGHSGSAGGDAVYGHEGARGC